MSTPLKKPDSLTYPSEQKHLGAPKPPHRAEGLGAMGNAEREALHASLQRGICELDEGMGIPAETVLAELEQYE